MGVAYLGVADMHGLFVSTSIQTLQCEQCELLSGESRVVHSSLPVALISTEY